MSGLRFFGRFAAVAQPAENIGRVEPHIDHIAFTGGRKFPILGQESGVSFRRQGGGFLQEKVGLPQAPVEVFLAFFDERGLFPGPAVAEHPIDVLRILSLYTESSDGRDDLGLYKTPEGLALRPVEELVKDVESLGVFPLGFKQTCVFESLAAGFPGDAVPGFLLWKDGRDSPGRHVQQLIIEGEEAALVAGRNPLVSESKLLDDLAAFAVDLGDRIAGSWKVEILADEASYAARACGQLGLPGVSAVFERHCHDFRPANIDSFAISSKELVVSCLKASLPEELSRDGIEAAEVVAVRGSGEERRALSIGDDDGLGVNPGVALLLTVF